VEKLLAWQGLGEVVQEEVEPHSEGAFILFLFYFGTIGT